MRARLRTPETSASALGSGRGNAGVMWYRLGEKSLPREPARRLCAAPTNEFRGLQCSPEEGSDESGAGPDQPDHRGLRGQSRPARAAPWPARRRTAPTCWSPASWPSPATPRATCSSARPSSRRRADRSTASPSARARPGWRSSSVSPSACPTAPPGDASPTAPPSCTGGAILSVHRKSLLPTYDVFDEWRYFEPASAVACAAAPRAAAGRLDLRGHLERRRLLAAAPVPRGPHREAGGRRRRADRQRLGLSLHDGEAPPASRACWPAPPAAGAGRWCSSTRWAGTTIWCSTAPAWCSTQSGELMARARGARARLPGRRPRADAAAGRCARSSRRDARSALGALVLGTRDYARRCGFTRAVLGLSGGIDSALVACIAARALGPENVLGVAMPSRYSSPGLAAPTRPSWPRNLGIGFREIPIEPVFQSYLATLAPRLRRTAQPDVTEENLQARVRGATADGAVEQAGLAAAHHRQQERAGHRVLHALRRHVRRPGGDQRRAQDAGLRPGPRGQRRSGR